MQLITYATPFFALLILLELVWDRVKGTGYYRINDAVNSLSMGILSVTYKLVVYGFGAALLLWTGENYGIWDISTDSTMAWVLTFIGYDFLYYWFHRISHERQLFWASHVAHHQSEEYNLTTALRQTSTSFFYGWIFYIPCFVAGVPAEMFFTVGAVNLLYQFWVHTRHIPKLGWFEWVFVTPSNHRVHHARNLSYVDRNYGGVFILWDRLFGSFQEEREEEPVEFGIRKPLASWNPLRANFHIYQAIVSDCLQARNIADKFYVWVAPTGWRPADLPAAIAPDLSARYDPQCAPIAKTYALCLLLSMYAWVLYYLFNFPQAPYFERLAGFGFIVGILLEAGAAMEDKLSNYTTHVRRILLLFLVAYLSSGVPVPANYLYYIYTALLLTGWLTVWRKRGAIVLA